MHQPQALASLRTLVLAASIIGLAAVAPTTARVAESSDGDGPRMSADTFAGLTLRGIGPAVASGRVGDFAVDPANRAHYYVAVASGGIWKTTNAGTTFTPVFDTYGSYSIGCLTLDPHNPNVVWAGTGENNSQRSVSFGDGVYRTRDGGKTWENLGLRNSEHIGMIAIDPRNSDTVYVAAQGPLWNAGGDRGLYKTTDGGQTWNRVLAISDDTGVSEVHLDPRDPDTLYASAYQRRRRVWTLIDGGPESAIYKSTDAGATWRKIDAGLPEVDLGRIGLDLAPANPDIIYAIIEAADDKGGVFRSTDRGEHWEKRSDYVPTSPQYYNEIVCDPRDPDRAYFLDTLLHVTEDGGKTVRPVPFTDRHVDNHALWIDPADTDYLLVGCDGGVYDTFDRGANWRFMPNLPTLQFYRVSVDHSEPFYYVYGGTQDNNSLGGPSRTLDRAGITNADWFVTVGGDGYQTRVDPTDPNTLYALWQYGGLLRYDRRSGEAVDIKPREAPGEKPFVWNWDTPLIISPHDPHRLYVAAQRLFRSDDRGNSWTALSGDLSRGIDRNQLEVMGRIQPADAVAKSESTSVYGNCVALTESPRVADLIYVGTDDGLVQVTPDAGKTWRRIDTFPGIPQLTYVSCLTASRHADDTVYAAFDNHKSGDFTPYLLRSTDRGASWTRISGDLPDRNVVYTVQEDTENPDLLFAGTEFGVFFTVDGGEHWIQLKGNFPTIAVRDIAVQRQVNDLALATFGRGFYILDDYTPLRHVSEAALGEDALLFPVKDALLYVPRSRLGGNSGRGSQGASFYAAPNPPFGAIFTYYLRDKLRTRRERRHEAEKKALAENRTPPYPTIAELRVEDAEKPAAVYLVVRDADGAIVRRVPGSREAGIHRANWDLRGPSTTPVDLTPATERMPWEFPPAGPLVTAGEYSVELTSEADGAVTTLAGPESFNVTALDLATFTAPDPAAVRDFRARVAGLQRAVLGAVRAAEEGRTRIRYLQQAVIDTPAADEPALADLAQIDHRLDELLTTLRGDRTLARRQEPVPPSIRERVEELADNLGAITQAPTQTQRDVYTWSADTFATALNELQQLLGTELPAVEARLEKAGAPWTPGRIPHWENLYREPD